MQMGMIGLGRMGANMMRRLIRGGHQCVVFDVSPGAVKELHRDNALMAKFFFVADPDGYYIEILQRHGRYR